jgi:uncharacterized protein YkwD
MGKIAASIANPATLAKSLGRSVAVPSWHIQPVAPTRRSIETAGAVVTLINQKRAAHGLPPYSIAPELMRAT